MMCCYFRCLMQQTLLLWWMLFPLEKIMTLLKEVKVALVPKRVVVIVAKIPTAYHIVGLDMDGFCKTSQLIPTTHMITMC